MLLYEIWLLVAALKLEGHANGKHRSIIFCQVVSVSDAKEFLSLCLGSDTKEHL